MESDTSIADIVSASITASVVRSPMSFGCADINSW